MAFSDLKRENGAIELDFRARNWLFVGTNMNSVIDNLFFGAEDDGIPRSSRIDTALSEISTTLVIDGENLPFQKKKETRMPKPTMENENAGQMQSDDNKSCR